MSNNLPTHTMLLLQHPNGMWAAEPVGVAGCKAGEFTALNTSLDLLLVEDARPMMANALRTPYTHGFNLRFVDPDGRVVATSRITAAPSGRHHKPDVTGEQIKVNDELRRQVEAEYAEHEAAPA